MSLIKFPSIVQLLELLDCITKYSLSTYYMLRAISESYLPTALLCAFHPHSAIQGCCQDGNLGSPDNLLNS